MAKRNFWIHPHVSLARSDNFDARALRELAQVIEERASEIERAWHEYFC
jgi:hypothetical protein